jgi:two-component system, NtrC family, sensor kinase
MKRLLIIISILFCNVQISFCQQSPIDSFLNTLHDSLLNVLHHSKEDTNTVNVLVQLSMGSNTHSYDSAIFYLKKGLGLAEKINYLKGEGVCWTRMGNFYLVSDNIVNAFVSFQNALNIFKKIGDNGGIMNALQGYAEIYVTQKDYSKSIDLIIQAERLSLRLKDTSSYITFMERLGYAYEEWGKRDSAEIYLKKANDLAIKTNIEGLSAYVSRGLGKLYVDEGKYKQAAVFLYKSMADYQQINMFYFLPGIYISIAKLKMNNMEPDSAYYYANKAFTVSKQNPDSLQDMKEACEVLSKLFAQKNDFKQALYFYKRASNAKDSMLSRENARQISSLMFQEKERQQEIITAKKEFQSKLILYISLASLLIILLIAILLYRNNKQQKNAKRRVENSYRELKSTQSQLIQSEKMASLGELTAGIAHEIQNPLNFVNNFSEVNTELIDELKQEVDKGNLEEVKAIATDIKDNEQKINHHGKRAAAIVKGMLQHSRSGSGQKEPTDINSIADEYLRLAYHGLRAKDKSFNAITKTNFDGMIGKINIIPQDIGRVILNLITNAFYVVNEKKNASTSVVVEPYEPTVSLSTKKINDKILISVKDNGNGIPQKVLDKIFQPFFTTKPTGQGTGLGLSLSYDIVKAHGGEIKVETKEGVGSEFIIQLPINS